MTVDDRDGPEGDGPESGGPPPFPGSAPGSVPPPPMPPPPPPPPMAPPMAPPSYPGGGSGGYPPPQAQFPAGAAISSMGSSMGSSIGVPYATWGTRVGGFLIDAVIFVPVLVVLYLIFRHSHVLRVDLMARRRGGARQHLSLLSTLLGAILYIGYTTILCGGPRGQTVGMMAVGVRVVRDGTGDVLGYGLALGRSLAEEVFRALVFLFVLLGVIWVLDMLWPLWDQKNQTLHDKVVGSVVLTTRNTG